MMRCLGLLLLLATNAWADSVGNGGGLSEQNFSYAYLNLSVAYDACLESPGCLSDPESRRLLLNLKAALPEEYRNRNQLQFKSGRENPGLFLVAGKELPAVTGAGLGDAIFINLDLLYPLDSKGKQRALRVDEAIKVLIGQMARHHQVEDELYLESFTDEILRFYSSAGMGSSLIRVTSGM